MKTISIVITYASYSCGAFRDDIIEIKAFALESEAKDYFSKAGQTPRELIPNIEFDDEGACPYCFGNAPCHCENDE
jgi:hypothetical protein